MKIWAEGEILTAKDINDNLNPATAENIPYAMAAGVAAISSGSPVGVVDVALPPGRFTATPIVTVTCDNSQYIAQYVPGQSTPDSIRLGLRLAAGGSFTSTRYLYWTAVQMFADSAQG